MVEEERYVILRFTEEEKLQSFYRLLKDNGLIDDLSAVTSDRDKAKQKTSGKDVSESRWSEWGADYDENSSEGVNDFGVGGA